MTQTESTLPLSTVAIMAAGQVWCEIHGEVVILDTHEGVYYGLNSVAARIWQLLLQPKTVQELRNLVMEEFDVSEDVCTRHIADLLVDLRDWKLVDLKNGETD